jgi:hypothetical protein
LPPPLPRQLPLLLAQWDFLERLLGRILYITSSRMQFARSSSGALPLPMQAQPAAVRQGQVQA